MFIHEICVPVAMHGHDPSLKKKECREEISACSARNLSFGWWLVAGVDCSERKILLDDGWFVLREKYCWLVADKPSEHAGRL
jgi:hypothetical protein